MLEKARSNGYFDATRPGIVRAWYAAASDALIVLNSAVGVDVPITCPACAP